MRKERILIILFLILINISVAFGSNGASTVSDLGYVPGELLVRFAPKAKGILL